MNTKRFKTIYSIAIVMITFLSGYAITQATIYDVPLHSGPAVNGSLRGQLKEGKLTIGDSVFSGGSNQLYVAGPSGLRVEKVNCGTLPNGWPCPTTVATGPELHVLQLGYAYKMVVGSGTDAPISDTMLDVRGVIKNDTTSLNYAGGAYYPQSTTIKPLCAMPNGEIATCGTTAACGPADGTTSGTAPSSNLCSSGTASSVTSNATTWTWTCTLGSNPPNSCLVNKLPVNNGGGGGGQNGG